MLTLAQTAESKKIFIDIDGCSFKYLENQTLWELYYSFPDTSFAYAPVKGGYRGEILFSVKIRSAVQIEAQKDWIVERKVDKSQNNDPMNMLGKKEFLLAPGQYTVTIEALDVNDTTTYARKEFAIFAPDFSDSKIDISEILLAQEIEQISRDSKWSESFKKSNLYVVPNPKLEYIGVDPVLKAYFEFYNAKSVAPEGFTIVYRIFDSMRQKVFETNFDIPSTGDKQAEIMELPLVDIPSGMYYLSVAVAYKSGESQDTSYATKKFYLINPEAPPKQARLDLAGQDYQTSEFSVMSEERVELELRQLGYIATIEQRDVFENLSNLEAKRRYLYEYWSTLDDNPETNINEARMEFLRKVKYANTYFAYGNREGWITDRGIVLLKYGFPTQREFHPVQGYNNAYEEWYYDDVQGGTQFYFVDTYGGGNFKLVHSTAINETYNPNWYQDYVPKVKENRQNENY